MLVKFRLSSEIRILESVTASQSLRTFPNDCYMMLQNHSWGEGHSRATRDQWTSVEEAEKFSGRAAADHDEASDNTLAAEKAVRPTPSSCASG